MKNNFLKILLILLFCFLNSILFAEELDIKANQIKLNKDTKITLAEGNVQISDTKRNVIFALSNFGGGQKRVGMLKVFSLKGNVIFGLIDF